MSTTPVTTEPAASAASEAVKTEGVELTLGEKRDQLVKIATKFAEITKFVLAHAKAAGTIMQIAGAGGSVLGGAAMLFTASVGTCLTGLGVPLGFSLLLGSLALLGIGTGVLAKHHFLDVKEGTFKQKFLNLLKQTGINLGIGAGIGGLAAGIASAGLPGILTVGAGVVSVWEKGSNKVKRLVDTVEALQSKKIDGANSKEKPVEQASELATNASQQSEKAKQMAATFVARVAAAVA